MGLFAKAATRAASAPAASKKKSTVWMADHNLSKVVHELTVLNAAKKSADAKIEVLKASVKKFAYANFVRDYVNRGSAPDSPMLVQNEDGEKLTFVAQDRGSQYDVKQEQKDALVDLLGEDAVEDILYVETTYNFNRELLCKPGVQDIVEKHLMAAIGELVETGTLSEAESESILDVKNKTSFKPGVFDRLTSICGRDVGRLTQFLDIASSSFTRYVKL
jgi:hypothetical protein